MQGFFQISLVLLNIKLEKGHCSQKEEKGRIGGRPVLWIHCQYQNKYGNTLS